jgi:hypothetical protein
VLPDDVADEVAVTLTVLDTVELFDVEAVADSVDEIVLKPVDVSVEVPVEVTETDFVLEAVLVPVLDIEDVAELDRDEDAVSESVVETVDETVDDSVVVAVLLPELLCELATDDVAELVPLSLKVDVCVELGDVTSHS